jgi:bifunctional N-acetylglucosamine-1-phosphate-uridyltransferase/glucosamine-1-phosphate-acetyltransferase GlmU-like protein
VKGVILAGGSGTRLHPLTRITNKHLLPIYDRPMVTWAIEALVKAGIGEMMLVTGGTHAGEFLRLLGNGHEYGIDRLLYAYQERPGGIAEALGLAGSSSISGARTRGLVSCRPGSTTRRICGTSGWRSWTSRARSLVSWRSPTTRRAGSR